MYVYIESKVYIAGVKYILHKEHPINKKIKKINYVKDWTCSKIKKKANGQIIHAYCPLFFEYFPWKIAIIPPFSLIDNQLTLSSYLTNNLVLGFVMLL